jgi:hypothetical protein
MANNISAQPAQPALDPVEHEQELIAQAIDAAFQVEPEEAIVQADENLKQLDTVFGNTGYETLRGVLGALRKFFNAFLFVRQARHLDAQALFEQSVAEFDRYGQGELGELAEGLACSSGAYLELQKGNISQALESVNQAKEHMKGVGQFGELGALMTLVMERDIFAISAMRAMSSLDYPAAKTAFEQAAQTSERIARDLDENSAGFNLHQGLAHFYRTYSTFNQTFNRFNQLRYDEVARQTNISADAGRARDLLLNSVKNDEGVNRSAYISEGLGHLLEVVQSLSQFMEKVLGATVKPDAEAFQRSRGKIQTASDLFAKAGPDSVSIIRFCDELSGRLNKIEELTRPSKKDFGKFSGIIACASFLPLFLVTSWVNSAFRVGVNPSTLIWYCIALALISGFGFGALRFKTLLFGEKATGKSAT